MNKHIILLFIILCIGLTKASAQHSITGKVLDATNQEPIPFASVTIKNVKSGTTTDNNGNFTLKVNNNDILIVSFMGYETKEVNIGTQKKVTILLSESSVLLDAVVVTGFQNLKKTTFTGSSVKIKADDINLPGETDISRMLEGKAAGVSIQNVSSTFGSAPKIRVRGATSINGENKPLWVVDGIVLEDVVNVSNDQLASGDPTTLLGSSVAGINTNDIETIDVLKDAAATALYGARAMNGVVVITTKRGKEGKPRIHYSGNYTVRTKPRYSEFNIMNSADQMSVYAEMERKGLLTSDIVNNQSSGIYGIMYNRINTWDESKQQYLLENTYAARHNFLMEHAAANTDWFDLLFTNSIMNEHTLSVSSGSQKSKSYISLGFLNDPGWTVADKVNRITMNFRNDYQLNDKIGFSFQTVGSVRMQNAPGSLSRSSDVVSGISSRNFDINPFNYALNTSRALRAYDSNGEREYYTLNFAPFNILEELDNNYIKLNVIDLKAQAEFNWQIFKGLKYNFTGAIRYVRSKQEHEIHENSNMANAYRAAGNSTIRENNPYLYKDPSDPSAEPIVVLPKGGFYNTAENLLLNYDIRNSVSFSKIWNEKHEFNALLGQQIKYSDRQTNSNTGYGFQYDMGGTVSMNYLIMKQMIEQNFDYYSRALTYDRFAAFYANVDYTYDRRYSISGTVRYDGSNTMANSSSARWLPTWNISGKWNIGNEAFMKDFVWLDALALRAGVGLTASMPPLSNATPIFINSNTTRPSTDIESGIEIYTLGNSDLTWEKSYQSNFGFDATFLKGRLDFSFDYFIRNSFDLLSVIKVSGIGGERYKWANSADLSASGFDITLSGKPIVTKDFMWSSSFTMGYSKNEIKNSMQQPQINTLVGITGGNKNGYPVNGLFSIPFAGLNPENGVPMFYDENGTITSDINFQSTSTDYLKYEGPTDPKYTGGFNNSFTWKGISLDIFFTFQAGNVIRLNPVFNSSYNDSQATPKEFFNRWEFRGDEKHTNIPAIADKDLISDLSSTYPYSAYNYSDIRVAKGDFIRLKSLSVGYTIPQKLFKSWKLFSDIRLRVTGKNLWLLYSDNKLNGQDPEFVNTGGVAQPIQKQVIFSLDVSF